MSVTIKNLLVSAALATVLAIFGNVSLLATPTVNAGKDGVALHGFDVVAYSMDRQPQEGQKRFTAEWRGAKYYFASEFNRLAFLSDPQSYVPEFDGYCAYSAAFGKKRDVNPAIWAQYKGQIYLFNNRYIRNLWWDDRDQYIADGEAKWASVQ